ncbi:MULTISPECIES: D-sedoheptulose 7-phosphate isomerase [unclassified Nitrobacter]|uniref:D-sedoheptulose 7-phosphate isomerase n=1 Tax=unclassified Nitrobacter TaxID=2620411 RepID=UPI00092BFA0A|nr:MULTISPECIES: D-sedoheptulose 7-phosphate isomerase [unclassified Nitrobacter]MBN9148320.1 D-sedoheptulose 7-phosphate isomerase [Nitrobacter sp.]OJU99725.1 MAG: sugar isomerase [Nitrobacter sp. 62-23]
MSHNQIAIHFQQSLAALERAAKDTALLTVASEIALAIIGALRTGHKVLLIGNGGSAADAQHIASEIVGRYRKERPGFAAIALTTDTSALTAISNDYGFEQIFARQIESLGRSGDVLLALSTSGRSPNILAALAAARRCGLVTVGLTGLKGTGLNDVCDHLFVAPSDDTPVIQQVHMTAAHAICDSVERALADGGT